MATSSGPRRWAASPSSLRRRQRVQAAAAAALAPAPTPAPTLAPALVLALALALALTLPRAADAFGPTSLVVLSVNDGGNTASGVTLTEFDYTNGNVLDTCAWAAGAAAYLRPRRAATRARANFFPFFQPLLRSQTP